jgi:hypothetical protein
MARVQWKRARFDTVAHAVIEGDVLVLCGAMTRKGPRPAEDFGHIVAAEAVPGMACPYCREIITEAAEALGVGSQQPYQQRFTPAQTSEPLLNGLTVTEEAQQPQVEVVDLVAALRASVEAAKARRAEAQREADHG